MAENQFSSTVESLFKGMENFVTTKTVVGDPIQLKGAVILPLVDVSFGCAAGANSTNLKNGAGGGLGGKITPSAVLVLQNGTARLVNIKNQDTVTKLLDMVPDLVNKFTKSSDQEEITDEEIIDAVQKDEEK
ncbi:MAG: sporulation protein [Lachnospiraceae bacterium]|nr:sporulation protein [Lachnospiraceae bacterium]